MPPIYIRLLNRLPKGVLSGISFGLLIFILTVFLLTFIYWVLRPFVWAAIYGEPYVSIKGPFSVQSGEWLFVQLIWFLGAIIFGVTVAHLSGVRAHWVFLGLVVVYAAFSAIGEPLPGSQGLRWVLQYIQIPAGLAIGYLLWHFRFSKWVRNA
jgi:hypothetical protein